MSATGWTGGISGNIPSKTSVDDNALRHFCIVVNATNTSIAFFFNGTEDVTTSNGNATLSRYNVTNYLGINQALTSTSTFIGLIDEPQIYNTSLTQAQIILVRDTPINSNAPSSGGSVSVSLNYPPTNSYLNSATIQHNFTPNIIGEDFSNASLWTNETGTFAYHALNTSAVTNNTVNTISNTYSEGAYIWNIQVNNSTAGVFAVSNRTLYIDLTSPIFTIGSNSSSSTFIGDTATFYLQANDTRNLNTAGYYILSSNNSGTWINNTAKAFTSTLSQNISDTLTLNMTSSLKIAWCYYFNDSAGNWNSTSCITPFILTTTSIWAVPSMKYCSDIQIDNTGFTDYAPFNYTMTINLTNTTGMLGNRFDVVFVNAPCWAGGVIEGSWRMNSTYQRFLVNDTTNIPAGGKRNVSVYWGNLSFVSDISNISQAHIFGDDFDNYSSTSSIYSVYTNQSDMENDYCKITLKGATDKYLEANITTFSSTKNVSRGYIWGCGLYTNSLFTTINTTMEGVFRTQTTLSGSDVCITFMGAGNTTTSDVNVNFEYNIASGHEYYNCFNGKDDWTSYSCNAITSVGYQPGSAFTYVKFIYNKTGIYGAYNYTQINTSDTIAGHVSLVNPLTPMHLKMTVANPANGDGPTSGAWDNLTMRNLVNPEPTATMIGQVYTNDVDLTAPTFSNIGSNVTNNTAVNTGVPINISAQWNDDVALSMYVNSSKVNTSGSWANGTWQSLTQWSNFTVRFPTEMGSNLTVKIYANDTSNNQNVTGTWFFWNVTTEKTNPTLHLALNGTEDNRTYSYPSAINATGWLETPSDGIGYLYRNGTLLGPPSIIKSFLIVNLSGDSSGIGGLSTNVSNDESSSLFFFTRYGGGYVSYVDYNGNEVDWKSITDFNPNGVFVNSSGTAVTHYWMINGSNSPNQLKLYNILNTSISSCSLPSNAPTTNELYSNDTNMASNNFYYTYKNNTGMYLIQIDGSCNLIKTWDFASLGFDNLTYGGDVTPKGSAVQYFWLFDNTKQSLYQINTTPAIVNYWNLSTLLSINATVDPSFAKIVVSVVVNNDNNNVYLNFLNDSNVAGNIRSNYFYNIRTGSNSTDVSTLNTGLYNYSFVYNGSDTYNPAMLWYLATVENMTLPSWSTNSSTVISPYSVVDSFFNLSWMNTSSAIIEMNYSGVPTNYSMTNSSLTAYSYSKILPAGTFYWKSYGANANGTVITDTWYFTISKAASPINITFNTSDAVSTNTPVNVTCNYLAELTANLYNNTTNVGNPYVFTTSSLGSINFTCNTTGNANYSAASTSHILSVTVSGRLIVHQVLDEKTLAPLTFNLTIYNATFSSINNNIVSYDNNTVRGNLILAISSSGYVQRNYYVNIPESGYPINITGYLLDSSSGVYVTYWAYSSASPLGEYNSYHKFKRFITTDYATVSESKADIEGKGTVFLDPYTTYVIDSETADGSLTYNISSYNPNPSFILKINFGGGGTTGTNVTWIFSGTTYSLTPTDIYLKPNNVSNTTAYNFTLNTNNSDIQWFSLRLIYWNGTVLYSSNTTTEVNGSSILVNLNYTNLNGTVIAETCFKKVGYDATCFNRTYIVWISSDAIPDALNYLKNSSGLPIAVLSLIALFCSLGIAMISNRVIRTGSGIIYLAVLTIFAVFDFFSFGFLIGLYLLEIGFLMYREIW